MKHEGVRYTGRFDFCHPDGPRCAWSASTISARFYGRSVSVRLRPYGVNYITVLIDGKTVINSLQVNEEGVYVLAPDLEEKEHEVNIVKRTEFYLGTLQFMGFCFEGGKLLPMTEPSGRRIEIIGDSITCGFGIEGTDPDMEYDPKYDNAYLSYGALAARELGAECTIIGYSGFGVMKDYEGNRANTLPSRYSLIIPEEKKEWDFGSWVPHIAVINLGTNDFSFGTIPDRLEFTHAYLNFVRRIHDNYPETKVICCLGPLMDGEALKVARECITDGVVGCLRQEKNDWVHFLEFEYQKEEDGYGIGKHPSIRTHRLVGRRLAGEAKRLMNW